MYDVIVVGARCAGSPLAMLLARGGARVLLVDRATFPSDTLNGNYIHAAGVRNLSRWGLVDAAAPAHARMHRVTYDLGAVTLSGSPTWADGEPAYAIAPRRRHLDALLVDAAAHAGAEVRQEFAVDELLWDGERVVGLRGRGADGTPVEERATVVVGADGLRSRVADAVGAQAYEEAAPLTCCYYSHWTGLPVDGLEVVSRPVRAVLLFTSGEATCVAVFWPHSEFGRVRADIEREFLDVLDQLPPLGERVRAAQRVEPYMGTANLPSYIRKPYGPGWALVGDAACRVDPITGEGITDAFRDVGLLAEALLGGGSDEALAEYQQRRHAAMMPIYRLTAQRAQLAPPTPEMRALVAGLVGNQADIDRFVGLTAGTESFAAFFAPDNISRIVGRGAVAA